MTDLTLYRVDGRGRINLDGVVADGVEFYTAETSPDGGSIVLTPVKVVSTTTKRTSAPTVDPDDVPPFDE